LATGAKRRAVGSGNAEGQGSSSEVLEVGAEVDEGSDLKQRARVRDAEVASKCRRGDLGIGDNAREALELKTLRSAGREGRKGRK
jgi:hypothetical protein